MKKNILKKILFYRDIGLFFWIVFFYIKAALKIILNREREFLSAGAVIRLPSHPDDLKTSEARIAPQTDGEVKLSVKNKACSEEKIKRYVNFFFYVKSRFLKSEYCFVRSLILCSVFRKYGHKARIRFNALKMKGSNEFPKTIKGHCWVVIDEKVSDLNEDLIFQFP